MFDVVRPEVVSLRANLLSPMESGPGSTLAWILSHGAEVQIYKPLAQGLLSDRYAEGFPTFQDGDHRSKKGWFTAAAHPPLSRLLTDLRLIVPDRSPVEVALAWLDQVAPTARILVGTVDPAHLRQVAHSRRTSLSAEQVHLLQGAATRYRAGVPAYLD